jgi:hypothetical protein
MVTRSLNEIIVAATASTIMALMIAGGGAALDRTASAAPGTEPTRCQPPFTWRDSGCKPPLSWYEPD